MLDLNKATTEEIMALLVWGCCGKSMLETGDWHDPDICRLIQSDQRRNAIEGTAVEVNCAGDGESAGR